MGDALDVLRQALSGVVAGAGANAKQMGDAWLRFNPLTAPFVEDDPNNAINATYAAGQQLGTSLVNNGVASTLKDVGASALAGLSSPYGVGQAVGGALASPQTLRSLFSPAISEITAYHGSPYNFDKFDLSKVGAGEGFQAQGHGLYFSESKPFAGSYRYADQPPQVGVAARYPENTMAALRAVFPNRDESWYRAAIDKAQERRGTLYTVDIPDEQAAKTLDWDAPLRDQPDVFRALTDAKIVGKGLGHMKGGQLVRELGGSDPAVSSMLKAAGLTGIKYQTAHGVRNYVMFDDAIPTITGKE